MQHGPVINSNIVIGNGMRKYCVSLSVYLFLCLSFCLFLSIYLSLFGLLLSTIVYAMLVIDISKSLTYH